MHRFKAQGKVIDKLKGPVVNDPDNGVFLRTEHSDNDEDQSLFMVDLSVIDH